MDFDLDHFGDDALKTAATVLRASVFRPADVVGRYGGEEFAVLLRDCEYAGANAVAERIRLNIEASVVRFGSRTMHITASMGITHVTNKRGLTAASLLQAADRALYRAKDNGRNSVCAVLEPVAICC